MAALYIRIAMQRFNYSELSNGFSKMVRDINTKNPKWKECIKEIDYKLRKYLNNEVFYNNIIQYELEINRIGQSIIDCKITYIERYFDEPKVINFSERVKTQNEVYKSILYAVENAIIQKVNRESKGCKVSGILLDS